jgi:DNA helicase-2/ATP-dependent DNA helicase PcrA
MFTPEQQSVVDHKSGHALVSAVAGSGKTDVLVARTSRMLNDGYQADRMLVLMFNKSAQEVFLQRLSDAFPDGRELPSVLTFHALGLQILRIWNDRNRIAPPQVIDDETYWMQTMRTAVDQSNDEGGYGMSNHPDQLRKYLSAVDLLKNLDYPKSIPDISEIGWTAIFWDNMKLLFAAFEPIRKADRMHGLSDLLYDAVMLLRSESDFADELRDSLDEIMVDEYQDSNDLQQWLIARMTHAGTSVMAVGDEDQCIYTWRGANPEYMVRGFENTFPNVVRYTLSRTFRYGHAVALMANHVLQYNVMRPDKLVVSGLPLTGRVDLVEGDSAMDMQHVWARLTAADAILLRAFNHADDVEWSFRLQNLPYRLEGAPLFPLRNSGLALRVCIGCATDKLYKPDPIEARAWIRWVDRECSSSWVDMLATIFSEKGIEAGIRQALQWQQLTTKQNSHLVQMLVWNGRLFDAGHQPDPIAAIGRRLADAWARNRDDRDDAPMMPGFVAILRDHMPGWDVAKLSTFLDDWLPHETGPLITSVHRSKGGGWPTVVLPHVQHGYFPTEEASEEERRLFYVAITRAKENLVMRVPVDPFRDALWVDPAQTSAEIAKYVGSTGKFVVEACPTYCQRMGTLFAAGPTKGEVLTSMARRYEQALYPTVTKSKGLWGALVAQ